ncbi:MAG: TonB-dependent receptor, partial [Muribaculaceae bacterium]|nr:TonB-dependent receptor [Muribaculaceae bacterium]
MRRTLTSIVIMLLTFMSIHAQEITVKGTVISKNDGEPLIGATVFSIETKKGVATDLDGNFTLSVPAGSKLKVTYVGYQDYQGTVSPQMTIELAEETDVLDEVVVVGYSTQKKADVTGAITAVSADELAKQNENNAVKAMQGRVPGMNITADGNLSGASTVRIRGVGTLNNNDPLYIIDGVPTKAGMHELNGNDIESIQILKDAASASIYGSRAANGVIIITTKKGKNLRITLDASLAASFYNHKLSVMNAEQYGRAMWQAYINDGQDPNTNALGYNYSWGYDSFGNPVLGRVFMNKYLDGACTTPAADTDWVDETTRTGFIQNYNFSVSGSTEKLSSFFSLSYYKNLGIIKDTDFDRFSARINNEYKPVENILTIGEHFTLSRTSEVGAPGGFMQNVLQFNPSLPVYTENGEFAGPVGGYPDRENPLARLERNKDNRYYYWRLFGDAYLNLDFGKGFSARTTFGLDYAQKRQRIFTYPITEGTMANPTNGVENKQEHWTRWMWNAVGQYNKDFGKNHIDALVGVELIREDFEWFSGYKEDFAILTPDYMWPNAGVGTAMSYGSSEGYSLVSFFGKANYSFDSRYLVGLTLRHDGSSRFGKNNRYATFPAVSLGWRASNEAFLRDVNWISELKPRFSWGQTGNQEISNYARYSIYVPNYAGADWGGGGYGTSYDIAGTNGGSILQSGFKRDQIGNSDIKWETTTQFNVGLDFGFLNNQLYGSFDWYHKKTSNILVEMVGIAAMGEGTKQWINAGEMINKGIEFNLGFRHTTSYGLQYEINGNIATYRNKITKLPATVAANGTFGGNGVESVIGHPLGSQVGYVADGIFKSQEEVDNHARQEGAAPGRIRWADLDNNGVIDERDQQWIFDP